METIIIKDGRFSIPPESEISTTKRRLHIKTPYMSRIDTLQKDDFTISSRQYFRHAPEDKPYIPEGFIEIDGVRFKVVEE